MSLMNEEQEGARTDPWGTPDVTSNTSDNVSPTLTRNVRADKKSLIISSVLPVMPYALSL